MISHFPIPIKITPRLDMVNIKRLSDFLFCNPASLAGKFVPLSGRPSLSTPVIPSVVFMPTKPCRTIFAFHIPRFFLPLKAAFNIAKDIFFYTGRKSINRFSAIIAVVFGSFDELNVIFSAYRVSLAIRLIAFLRTESQVQLIGTAFISHSWLSAIGTSFCDQRGACLISAFGRTILLFRMAIRNHKGISAKFTNPMAYYGS